MRHFLQFLLISEPPRKVIPFFGSRKWKEVDKLVINDNGSEVCPYLGLSDDPGTVFRYPSSINQCYRAKPATPVKLKYQGTCCLTTNHSECKVYQNDAGLPLPRELEYQPLKLAQSKRSKVYLWTILFAIVVIGLTIWGNLSNVPFLSAGREHPSGDSGFIALTEMVNLTPSVILTLIRGTSTATLLPRSPSPIRTIVTSTPTAMPFHALETPIGIDHQFIIHRILDGESLNLISGNYGTTPEALQLINYDLQIPLPINSLIIIPFHKTDVSGLPVFEAYMVKADIPVEDLAQRLMVDPAMLMYYNDLQSGQVLTVDEWVLIPHISKATP